jgi:hypothetical protein
VNHVNDVDNVSSPVRADAVREGAAAMAVAPLADEAGERIGLTTLSAVLRRRGSSAVRHPQRDELSAAALASLLHCVVDVPAGLLSSYVVSVVRRRRVPGAISTTTSITCERRQSRATTGQSQTACT